MKKRLVNYHDQYTMEDYMAIQVGSSLRVSYRYNVLFLFHGLIALLIPPRHLFKLDKTSHRDINGENISVRRF